MYVHLNNLYHHRVQDLVYKVKQYFGTTHLDLSGNSLLYKPTADLIEMFKAIPPLVVILDLSANALGYKTAAD